MGPDREMAEAETDVSRWVQRELRRVRTRERELRLIGTDGHYSQRDLGYGSGLSLPFKRLVIEVPDHADWGFFRGVLVARPCCIGEAIT